MVGNSCTEKQMGESLSPENDSTIDIGEDAPQESQNPNEIVLTAFVIETFDAKKEICGQEKQNVVAVKIDRIVSHGQGIVNLPKKDQELLVHFLVMNEKPEENQKLALTAQESLCADASKTYFTILKHEISE